MDESLPKLFDCPDFLEGKYCHALCNLRHQTEEEKRAIDEYQESLASKPNPKKTNRYGPVYLIAGPERSGTSWLFNAVRLLLLREKSAWGPSDSYRLNHITKNDLETRLIEADGRPLVVRTMRIPDPDWCEELDRSGHGFTVFVAHRDLRDVIDDCLAIGWMKHDLAVILPRLKTYMIAFEHWRTIAKGDFRYESTRDDPVEQIKHLARLMNIESEHAEYISKEIYSLRPGQAVGPDQVTKMWPAQRVIETTNKDENDNEKKANNGDATIVVIAPSHAKLSDREREKIRDAHDNYHDRYGYV